MEVAALGLRVDANGVDSAAKSLENLTVQGAKAERAIAGVEGAASKTGKSLKTLGEGSAKGLEDINKVAPNSAEGLGRVSKSAEDAKKKLREMNSEMESGSKAAATMGGATDALSGYVKALAGAAAGISFAGLVKDSTLLAARFETMGVVMGVAGNNAGYTRKEMDDLSKSLQQQGISMLQSRNSLTQLATANIDLSKATGLARSAQDLAVVGNINSSEALERMIHGIKAGEVEVLRTLGLNVSFEASYKKLAQTLGVNSESLDENQKMMARTNAVLDGSTRYLGIYEESMTTAGKAMTSLTRYWEDFKVQAGDAFLPTLATSVFSITDALKAMNKEIEDSGQGTDVVARALNGAFKTGLETVTVLGANVAYVFRAMGLEIGGIAAQAAAVARLDFSGAAEIGRQITADAEANRAALDKFEQSVLNSNAAVAVGTKVSEEKRIADGKAAKAAEDAANKTLAQKNALTAFTKQFGTDAEKNKIAADEWKAKLGDLWSPEMIAKIEKRGKAAAASAKMEQTEYQRLMATVKAKIATNEEELFAGGKLNESAKLRIQLQAQLDSGSKKLTAAHKAEIKQQIDKLETQEKEEKAIKRAITLNDARLAQDQEMAEAQAAMQAKVDAVRLSIYDYSVAVKDSIEMSNLEVQTLGMNSVARNTLIEQLRIEQDLRRRIEAIRAAPYASQEARDADIATVTMEAMKAKANAQTKAYVSEWEKAYDQSSQALTDALMRGGKNAGEYLKDYFRTLVLRPVIQAIVQPVAGGIADGVTSVLGLGGSGGGAGSALGALGNISKLSSLFGGGATAGASLTSLGFANAVGLAGGDAIGALAAANGMWAGVATGAQAAAQAAVAANVALEAGTAVALEAGTLATASGAAGAAGGLSGALSAIPGWGWALAGGALLLSSMDFGSRGANHTGGAYSTSTGDRNAAASQALGSDAWGNALGDITQRANTALDAQLGKTVDALSGVYTSLAKYAGSSAKQIDIAAAFAVNPSHSDEDNYGYFRLIDKLTGEALSTYKARDGVLGTDPEKAYAKFVAEMGGALVEQLKAADIPGWMRSIFDGLGDEVTVDGLNQAIQAIAAVDAAFKGWADTLQGFSGLSAEVQTALLNVSGGIEGLGTNVNAFYGGFYSEAERMGILQRQVLEQLSSLGVTVDTSTAEAAKESFRATVEGALAAGNGELAAKLLALSGSFATAADYATQAADAASNAAKETADAAKEAAAAVAELAANLRSSLIGLESQFAGGGFARQYRAEDLAGQVQGLFAGVGIQKDAGVLAGQILSATSGEVEEYFRSMWSMLDTDEAREKLVTVTGALLDLAGSAETAANSVTQERAGLEQRWLQATGNTAELRRRELEALDPSNRALLQMIYGLEDAKTSMTDLTNAATTAAQKAAAAWQNWGTAAGLGATYLGDTSGLEARRAILGSQIAGSTDPADRLAKLQELISVEQAIGQAQQASRKTELEAIQARQSALQKEVASAQQLLSAAQGLGSYVQSLRLGEASGLSEADRLGALGNEYTALVGKARGGDADALQRLQSVAGDYLSLSQTLAASGADYSVLAGRVSAELEAVSKAQELVAQSQVTGYEAQIAQLAQQSELLSAQVELSDGTKSLIAKSMVDQADAWDRENTQALTLQELQQRAVDSLALMPAGIASAIKPTIEGSATYIANSVGGSVSSAINALAGLLGGGESLPAFDVGTNYVQRTTRAIVHQGEAIIPRAFNPWAGGSGWGRQADAELIAEVRALRAEVAALKQPMEQTAAATTQQAEQFDNATAGGNGMAVSIMEQAAPLQVKEVA